MTTIDNSLSSMSSVLSAYLSNKTSTSASSTSTTSSSATSSTSSISYSDKTALGRYINTVSSSGDTASAKTIFEKLSIDLGGGGKSINKDQLDSYISKASSGTTTIPKDELTALKTLQSNWNDIAIKGSDSISYNDVLLAGKNDTLLSMVPDTTITTKTDYKKIANDATVESYSKIVKSALSFSADSVSSSDSSNSSTSNLTSVLNKLLTGTTDENDDSNANLIDTLTNLIANSKNKTSTIELKV